MPTNVCLPTRASRPDTQHKKRSPQLALPATHSHRSGRANNSRRCRRRLGALASDSAYDHEILHLYSLPGIIMCACHALISAPMRAIVVKRAYEPGPVATCCRPGWADCSSGSFLAAARVFSRRGQGSSWSARSRAAARTNELDTGQRRKIIEGGEGPVAVGLSGSRAGSRCWLAE